MLINTVGHFSGLCVSSGFLPTKRLFNQGSGAEEDVGGKFLQLFRVELLS